MVGARHLGQLGRAARQIVRARREIALAPLSLGQLGGSACGTYRVSRGRLFFDHLR